MTIAAASSKSDETKERNEIKPCERMVTVSALRSSSKTFPLGHAMEEHRREASEAEANESNDDKLKWKRQVFFEGGGGHMLMVHCHA